MIMNVGYGISSLLLLRACADAMVLWSETMNVLPANDWTLMLFPETNELELATNFNDEDLCPNVAYCWILFDGYIWRKTPTYQYKNISLVFSAKLINQHFGTRHCIFYFNIDDNGDSSWTEFYRISQNGYSVTNHIEYLPVNTWNNVNIGIKIESTTTAQIPDGCYISDFALKGIPMTLSPTLSPTTTSNPTVPSILPSTNPTITHTINTTVPRRNSSTNPTINPTINPTTVPSIYPTIVPSTNPIDITTVSPITTNISATTLIDVPTVSQTNISTDPTDYHTNNTTNFYLTSTVTMHSELKNTETYVIVTIIVVFICAVLLLILVFLGNWWEKTKKIRNENKNIEMLKIAQKPQNMQRINSDSSILTPFGMDDENQKIQNHGEGEHSTDNEMYDNKHIYDEGDKDEELYINQNEEHVKPTTLGGNEELYANTNENITETPMTTLQDGDV
eukprot:204846_1